MMIEPEKSSVAIVLIGAFNPTIFTPEWFRRVGFINEEEFNSSHIEVTHRDVSIFKLDWVDINVQQNQFVATTTASPYVRLSDLVVRTFKEFLSQTPLSMLGINRIVEFSVGNEEVRNRIGHVLAPPAAWGDWHESIASKNKSGRGGMRQLRMQENTDENRDFGYLLADVQPSATIGTNIIMSMNDHYQFNQEKTGKGEEKNLKGNPLINVLESNFENSLNKSEWVIDQVMRLKHAV